MEQRNQGTGDDGQGLHADDGDFYCRLQAFPCLFLHPPARNLTSAMLSHIRRKINYIEKANERGDSDCPEKQLEGKFHHLNVYVLWRLRHVQEAKQEAERVLREHPDIIARTNMAFILRQQGEVATAEEQLQALTDLREESSGDEYEEKLIEAKLCVAFLYYQIHDADVLQHAVDIYEEIIRKRPGDCRVKLFLARTIMRPNRMFSSCKVHGTRPFGEIERAVDLLVEVKNETRHNTSDVRAKAALCLGRILYSQYDDDIRERVKAKAKSLGLDCRNCYQEATTLGHDIPSVLFDAAKYFRLIHLEKKSVKLLKTLIKKQPKSANAYYHLGLSFKKRAIKAKQFTSRGEITHHSKKANWLEKCLKCPTGGNVVFSRNDSFVKEVMENFQTALCLSDGEYFALHYDLGLMHNDLGEYEQALRNFRKVIANCPRAFSFFPTVGALEHAGLAMQKLSEKEWKSDLKEESRETGLCLLKMAVNYQSRYVKQERQFREHNLEVWGSPYTLTTSLSSKLLGDLLEDTPPDEAWLLRHLKVKGQDYPVVGDFSRYTQKEAEDPLFLEDRVRVLQRKRRYVDAAMLVTLLKLTSVEHALCAWRDTDLHLKVHVQAARDLLLSTRGVKDVCYEVRTAASGLLFRWAFEDRHGTQPPPPRAAGDASPEEMVATPPKASTPAPASSRREKREPTGAGGGSSSAPALNAETFDVGVLDEVHVLIVHDPSDHHDADTLGSILRDTLGLKAQALASSEQLRGSPQPRSVPAAQILLVLLTTETACPGFPDFVSKIVAMMSPATRDRQDGHPEILTVVKGDPPLPAACQGHRSLPWAPELGRVQDPKVPMTDAHVTAVCRLFCFLLDLKLDF